MTWVKIDDGFYSHEKVRPLTDRAFRLHVSALCYCSQRLTDGAVAAYDLRVITAVLGWSANKRLVAELVKAGLWIPLTDGHTIKDFTDYNPTSEEVKEQRRRSAERQKRHRHALRNGVTNAAPSPSRPDPGLGDVTQSPSRDAAQRGGAKETQEPLDLTTIGRLVAACGGGQDATQKIARTIRAHKLGEADIAWALESACGPNVRDPLAVALAELKKRGEGKAA